jgi:hypothetical protein
VSGLRSLPTLAERIALIRLGGPIGAWESGRLDDWSKLSWGTPRQLRCLDHIGERLYGAAWWDFTRGVELGAPVVSGSGE